MKRQLNLLLLPICVILSTFMLSTVAEARAMTGENLLNYPGINLVDYQTNESTGFIPAEYATALRPSSKLTYTVVGSSKGVDIDDDDDPTAAAAKFRLRDINDGRPHYVQLNKLAVYNGSYIDLRMNLVSMTSKKSNPTVKVYLATENKNFLRINTSGKDSELQIRYEFYKHGTNEKVDFSGMWNFKRINKLKSVSINESKDRTKGLFTYTNSSLEYQEHESIDGFLQVFGIASGEKPDMEFTALMDTDDGDFEMYINTINGATASYTKYEPMPITRMELPSPQIVGEVTDSPNLIYEVIQDMPEQIQERFYPKDYKLTVNLDPLTDMTDLKMEVFDIEDNPASQFFDAKKDVAGKKLTITMKNNAMLKNKNFVDNSYRFEITSKVTDTKKLKTYYNPGSKYYEVPASVQYVTDMNTSKQNIGHADLKPFISATPQKQTVAQGSSTSDWKKFVETDLFDDLNGAFDGDEVEISKIENKTFNVVGNTTVKVTLKGNRSGLSVDYDVPVVVLGERTAILNYVDKDGKVLSPIVTKKGFETYDYDFSKENIKIPNYRFVKVDEKGDPEKGTYPTENKTLNIRFVYELDDQDVTVRHVDGFGKDIFKKSVSAMNSGKDHTIESANIPGYKVKSVKVDNKESDLSKDGKTTISVKDKGIDIVFIYESVHYSLDMKVNKSTISQRDDITYTLNVKSGMVYPTGVEADDYSNVAITIPIDERLENIDKIEVLSKNDTKIGIGQYDDVSKALKVTLSEKVKNTEDFKVTYVATVKPKAKTNDDIKAEATMSASYLVNGAERDIKKTSNEVKTTIMGGLRFLSTPDEIDFGSVEFKAKNATIGVQKIDKQLVVSDTRSNAAGGWTMTAEVVSPIQTTSGKKLDGQITYRKGNEEFTLTSDAKAIYKHQTTATDPEVNVSSSWGQTLQSDGVKLKFKSTDMLQVGEYKGKIQWKLIAGQP